MTTKIKLLLQDLERNIPFSNQLNKDISGGNISWHIEHTLLTLDRIIDRLSETDSHDYQLTVNFPKIFVFATGIIPKGKAEAPPSTSCRFINSALKNELGYDSYAEFVIKNLFRANCEAVINNKSKEEQQIKLAGLIINQQANEIMKLNCFQHKTIQNRISIKGLITTRKTNQIIQAQLL